MPMQPLSAIILKLVGSVGSPFLWMSFTMDSPQEEGGEPVAITLENSVARIWWLDSSFRSTEKGTPSGPGAEVLLQAFRIFLMSRGLNGVRSKGWNEAS